MTIRPSLRKKSRVRDRLRRQASRRMLFESLELRQVMTAAHPIFAPGTPDDYVQQVEDAFHDTTGGNEFQLGSRWSSTATNGGGLQQGDPTTITWSIVPDGTSDGSASSNLIAFMDGIYGTAPGPVSARPWFPLFQSAFDRWSSVSGIDYVYEPNDDGAAMNSSAGVLGVRGDSRIMGRSIDGNGGILAFNYFPDVGDMTIDTNDIVYSDVSNNSLILRNVLAHEFGHGLGLFHVEPINQTKLMEPFLSTNFDGPQHDDILAVNRLYGDRLEPNDTPQTASDLGLAAVQSIQVSNVSIDDNGDTDFYSLTLASGGVIDLTLSPFGFTYLEGPQGGPYAPFDSRSQSDLVLQVIDPDGNVLATADATGAGANEVLSGIRAPQPGTYLVRVTGKADTAQLYSLDITTNTLPVGPRLISVNPNDGAIFDPDGGDCSGAGAANCLDESPRELTFRFDGNQQLDPNTLDGIQITRSVDGIWDNGNDIVVTPDNSSAEFRTTGFRGFGENQRIVITRFAQPLPDDLYRIEIFGYDDPSQGIIGLRNRAGEFFIPRDGAANPRQDTIDFEIDTGAQIVAVVPQPVDRVNGVLQQRRDQIEVYFNDDNLDPVAVHNPNFYQLIFTADTVRNTDDVRHLPMSIAYDSTLDKVTLTFATDLSKLSSGPGTYRLRIGTDEAAPMVPLNIAVTADPGSSFLGANTQLGNLAAGGSTSQILSSTISPQPYHLEFPGDPQEPGHRDTPFDEHYGSDEPADSVTGITVAYYNFQQNYGVDPLGNPLRNAITDAQKTRTREIFELLSQYMGIRFIETADQGITVITGDPRAIDPTSSAGATGIDVIAETTMGLSGRVILNAAKNWYDGFGDDNNTATVNWFENAMSGIGLLMGQGFPNELAPRTIQGDLNDPTLTSPDSAPGLVAPNVRAGEPVFPGDHDIVHGQHLFRPESQDVDLYQFTVTQPGLFTVETFAERLPNSSLLDTVVRLYRESIVSGRIVRELVAQNDDYYSSDSFLELPLGAGKYYVGVSASGNDDYDPSVTGSGLGGTSEGDYQLRVDFRPDVSRTLVDATGTAFDGDSDGVPGGVYDFWFRSQELNRVVEFVGGGAALTSGQTMTLVNSLGQSKTFEFRTGGAGAAGNVVVLYSVGDTPAQLATKLATAINGVAGFNLGVTASGSLLTLTGERRVSLGATATGVSLHGKTIFVDKSAPTANADGSLARPFNNLAGSGAGITNALSQTVPGDIVRVVGNGGLDGQMATTADNLAFEIGFGGPLNSALSDGTSLIVPKGVTLMIDAGAILKLRQSHIGVGSTTAAVDRSGAALQVLGTPQRSVIFTSYDDESIGIDTNPVPTTPGSGNWGGIVFRDDVDRGQGRFTYDRQGIFLNFVNHAELQYGGGNVNIDGVLQIVNPIHITQTRPTITENIIRRSADAAISADPNSFEESNFHSPEFQLTGAFTSDYQRIGPDIHGNLLSDNSTNGLFVRILTPAGTQLQPMSVAGRFNDTDIVHVISEALQVQGTPGGPLLEETAPALTLVAFDKLGGGTLPAGSYQYKVAFVDANGNEGFPTAATSIVSVTGQPTQGSIRLRNLPAASSGFVARRIYRSDAATNSPFVLVAQIDATTPTFVDDGRVAGGRLNVPAVGGLGMTLAAGTLTAGTYNYKVTFVDALGRESLPSDASANITIPVGAPRGVALANLPVVSNPGMVRRIYRSSAAGGGTYLLIGELNATDTAFVDNGSNQLLRLDEPGLRRARLDARLSMDPGLVVKLEGGRIELGMGAQLIAEGQEGREIVFTARSDDRFGASGVFDTNNDDNLGANENTPDPGSWGGIFASQGSSLSIDHALITYAGGVNRIEGNFAGFNAVEIHQARARITNSVLENNASGVGGEAATHRSGRGYNEPAAIFVRGAQPVIVNNVIRNNGDSDPTTSTAAISINVNSLNSQIVSDWGRSTGALERISTQGDNQGPLIRENRLGGNEINGMSVRGGLLTTQGVWDDTDIVHVVTDEVVVPDFHTFGGLRLESDSSESLVIKLAGANAGFTATGRPLDIDDRIGGAIQVIGAPGFNVVFTSLADDSVGAGYRPDGLPQTDTNNDLSASTATPGAWRSLRLDQFSNDRNIDVVLEDEAADVTAPGPNASAATAQLLGTLASGEKTSDENLRLGFELHGYLTEPRDVDVYSFRAEGGTEVWLDIDRTSSSLDTVLELIDAAGNVLARSNDSASATGTGLLGTGAEPEVNDPLIQAFPLDKSPFVSNDRWTTNPRDAGFRVVLPGTPGIRGVYHVRVSANQGDDDGNSNTLDVPLTSGYYQLQVRIKELDEIPGSAIRYADIRYASTGIEILGLPGHSPLLGEAVDTEGGGGNNGSFDSAQALGNLLNTDRASLAIAGRINPASIQFLGTGTLFGRHATDQDWYSFRADFDSVEHPINNFVSTVFDVDYSDGLGRGDLSLWVFDTLGNLILVGRDSFVTEDGPAPLNGIDLDDLSRGSAGSLDPFIGPVYLPETDNPDEQYRVVVTSNSSMPQELDQFTSANATNPLVRLEPVNSVQRIAEDRIGFSGGSDVIGSDALPVLFDSSSSVPFHLGDVTLFVGQDFGLVGGTRSTVRTVNPFTGQVVTTLGSFGQPHGDLAMRGDGELFTFSVGPVSGGITDGNVGNYLQIDTGTAAATSPGDDGVETYINDPMNPGNAIRPNNNNGVGVMYTGIAYRGTADLSGFAVGNRGDAETEGNPFNTIGPQYSRNVLYNFNINSGAVANRGGAQDRSGAGLLAGAGTQRIEIGEILTLTEITPNNVDIGDTFNITINGQTVSYTATAATANDVVGGLATAIRTASLTVPEFAAFEVANTSPAFDDVLQLRLRDPEGAFSTITTSTVDGGGFNLQTLTNAGFGPGGDVTGLAFLNGQLFGVTDRGGLFTISTGGGFGTGGLGTYVRASAEDLLDGPKGTAITFSGLTPGPRSTENGAYTNMMFAIDDSGALYALNSQGQLQPVFVDGLTYADTGMTSATGLAFSTLDRNLWQITGNRGSDAGHGILQTYDDSRVGNVTGGSSFYFGNTQAGAGNRLNGSYNALVRNYNFPGGAQGTLESNTFSLKGYRADDIPVLYFNYFLETEATDYNPNTNPVTLTRDTLRVYVVEENGQSTLLATNDTFQDSVRSDEFDIGQGDGFCSTPSNRLTPCVQPLFDNTGGWRQARVHLDSFAGQENLRLRFEFSTAGATNIGDERTTGSELRAIPGEDVRDGVTFQIDNQTFEFELGYSIVAPTGAALTAGSTFTVNGITFTMIDSGVPIGNQILFNSLQNASEVATSISNALTARGIAHIVVDNRINLTGTTHLSVTGMPAGFVDGAPGVTTGYPVFVNSGMTRTQVAQAIAQAMADVFSQQLASTVVSGTSEVEPNNSLAGAQNIDSGAWNLQADANIGDFFSNTSTTIPHISIRGSGDGTFDYYSFTVPNAGARGIFDIDLANFDSELFLFDAAGNVVAQNDDTGTFAGAGGSTSGNDAFIQFVFPAAGTYTIGVGQFNSVGTTGAITGATPLPGNSYTLQISVSNHALGSSGFVAPASGGLDAPEASTFGPDGNVYVSSSATNQILRYDGTTGAFMDVFVTAGTGGLSAPEDLLFGSDGNLYVASRGSNQVLRFEGPFAANPGNLVDVYASGNGLSQPRAMTFATNGSLLVTSETSATTSAVLRFAGPTAAIPGTFLGTFIASGTGGLDDPTGLAFGSDGNLYISDTSANAVLRYSGFTGNFLGIFASTGLNDPQGLTFGPDGHLYVSESTTHSVLRFSRTNGGLIDTVVNSGASGLNFPTGLIFGSDDRLYVASRNTDAVIAYGFTFVGTGDASSIKTYRETVKVINHTVSDPGPLGFENDLAGDSFGAFNTSGPPQSTQYPGSLRGMNNAFEGAYIDDVIIGFAERGEMVTRPSQTAGGNQNFVPNPDILNTELPAGLTPHDEILVGEYQLEVRRGPEYGIWAPNGGSVLSPTRSFNTNDRLSQQFTIIAPAGNQIADGQGFTLTDGVNSFKFEYDDLGLPANSPNVGVTPNSGNVRIPFFTSDTAEVMAQRIRDAINSAVVQDRLQVVARLSDGAETGVSTSNRVELFGSVSSDFILGQLEVIRTTTDGNSLRDALLTSGITSVGDASFVGSNVSAGFFTGGLATIGIEAGILLTTGNAMFAEGPNAGDFSTGTASLSGDLDLDAEFGFNSNDPILRTQDSTVLEFAIDITTNDLFFNFVFASEEYNEFVNSNFNDVFAFFVDGVNIGLLPGTSIPVSINTVNGGNPFGFGGANSQFYNNNDASDAGPYLRQFGYDGFTDVFTASALGIGPGRHIIKLAISDVGDPNYDSAVFIEPLNAVPVDQLGRAVAVRYDEIGDSNTFRDQGQVLVHSNVIRDSSQFGVRVDAGQRSRPDLIPQGGTLPHAGPVRNFDDLNTERLAPGPVIANNVISGNQSGGIQFSGEVNTLAPGAVPFGRIVNNTIYGRGAGDVGIDVSQSASPTILNNIVSNLSTGIRVDATSTSTVIGATLYQNNTTNAAGSVGLGSFPIQLAASDPLFVNPSAGNFYLRAGSRAIDSSIDSLDDRSDFAERIKAPLGIGASPILTPDRDAFGQLRADDPAVATPAGQGANVFKDRGALDRADFAGLVAELLNPRDNDSEGLDVDPNATVVQLLDGTFRRFELVLVDGDGTGPDAATLSRESLTIVENGVLLIDGVDYTFGFNDTSNIIRLTPLSGIWRPNASYVITLNNKDRFVITTPDGSQVVDGDQFTITNGSAQTRTFEYESGYSLQIPQSLQIHVPAAGAGTGGILDGQTFIVSNGTVTSTFEFDDIYSGNVAPGRIRIPIAFPSSADEVAQAIGLALSNTNLGLSPQVLQGGVVHLGSRANHTLNVAGSALTQSGQARGVTDGDLFTLRNGPQTVRFEFDTNGTTAPGNLAIGFSYSETNAEIGDKVATAIAAAGLGLDDASHVGNGLVHIGGTTSHVLDVTGSNLTVQGTPGVSLMAQPIVFRPTADFTADQMALVVRAAINASGLPGVAASSRGGATLFIDGVSAINGISNFFLPAIRDVAGNPLQPNQPTTETQFTILLPGVELDYGDASDPANPIGPAWPTTRARDGARHVVLPFNDVILGTQRDAEPDGLQSPNATGDGADEDGIVFNGVVTADFGTPITVTASGEGILNAWIDYNQDGVFDYDRERVIRDLTVDTGDNSITLPVTPASARLGPTFARFRISQSGGLFPTGIVVGGEVEDYAINVISNAPPVVVQALPPQQVSEDAPNVTLDLSTIFNDVDITNGNNDVLTFSISGDSNPGILSPAINGSQLVLDFLPDRNGTTTLTVRATDHGGKYIETALTITVLPINDAPVVTLPGTLAVVEDTPQSLASLVIDDVDASEGSGILRVTMQVASGAITLRTNVGGGLLPSQIIGNGTSTVLINASPAALQATMAATGGILYTPALNYFGDDAMVVTASDQGEFGAGGPQTTTATMSITISSVNDAPTWNAPTLINTREDVVTDLSAVALSDVDAGSASIQVSLSVASGTLSLGSTANLGFSVGDGSADSAMTFTGTLANINAALGGMTYLGNADFNGSETLTLFASDLGSSGSGGVRTSNRIVNIVVAAVNDQPLFAFGTANPNQQVVEDAGLRTVNGFATNIRKGPATAVDEVGQGLSFQLNVVSVTGTLAFSTLSLNAGNGNLLFQTEPDTNGQAVVEVRLVDDGGTANGGNNVSDPRTFTITVDPVNDAPTFTKGPNVTINEDTGLQGCFTCTSWATNIRSGPPTATDEDTQTLSFQVSLLPPVSGNLQFTQLPVIDPLTGNLSFETAPNTNGVAQFRISLRDSGSGTTPNVNVSSSQTFAITVTAVNDAPEFTKGQDVTSDEDAGPQSVNAWASGIRSGPPSATDEAGQLLTFETSIIATTGNLSFATAPAINSATGELTYTTAANTNGTASVRVLLRDSGSGVVPNANSSAIQTFNITVNAVNDVPVVAGPASRTFAEDARVAITGVSISDLDAAEGNGNVLATLQVGQGSILVNPAAAGGVAVANITGNGTSTVSLLGTTAQINATLSSTDGLTYQGRPNFNGRDQLVIVVDDMGNRGSPGPQQGSTTVSLTVTALNDSPQVINPVPDFAVNEDAPDSLLELLPGVFQDVDVATNSDVLTFSVVENSNAALVTPAIVTGASTVTLRLSYRSNQNGVAVLKVQARDLLGATAVDTFTVTVNAINDPPSVRSPLPDLVVDEDGADGVIDLSSVFTDVDIATNNDVVTLVPPADNNRPELVGTTMLGNSLLLDYQPDMNGVATVAVRAQDLAGATGSSTFRITVREVNDPPVPGTDQRTTAEDVPLQFSAGLLRVNDAAGPSDEAGQTLVVTAVGATSGRGGTVTLVNGVVTYTPPSNYNGIDTFTYSVTDDGSSRGVSDPKTATGTVTVTVTDVNDPPIPVNDAQSSAEDNTATILASLLAVNDLPGPTDEIQRGQILTVTGVNPQSAQGGAVLFDGTNLYYTPAADFNGVDTILYTVRDNGTSNGAADFRSSVGTLTVTVTPVNDEPIPTNDSVNATEDQASNIPASTLLSNDRPGPANESAQSLSVVGVGGNSAAGGTVVLNVATGRVTYTAPRDFNGIDTFTYIVADNGTTGSAADPKSSTATVTVTVAEVNDPPQAVADTLATAEDTPRVIAMSVLTLNDSRGPANESGQNLAVTAVGNTSAAGGTISLNTTTGEITFTPAPNFNGTDTFTYVLTDDGRTSGNADPKSVTGTVTVTVSPVNDAPIPGADSVLSAEDTVATIAASALAVNDLPGPSNEIGQLVRVTAVSASSSRGGTVSLAAGTVSYSPPSNFNGVDTFTYTVIDDGLTNGASDPRSSTGTVTVTVTAVNDIPAPVGDTLNTAEDTSVAVDGTLLAANDLAGPVDEQGQSVELIDVATSSSHGGVVTFNASTRQVTYTPAADFAGVDTFTYTVRDNGTTNGSADPKTAVGTVTVTVTAVNDAPTAVADSYNANEDAILLVSGRGVLANDLDVDVPQNTLTVRNFTAFSAQGASVIVNPDGTFTYDPTSVATLQALKPGQVLVDTFTYQAFDGVLESAPATVTIQVTGINDAPVANDDPAYSILEDRTLTVNVASGVLGNDRDPESDPITAVRVSGPANGVLSLNPDGSFSYQPNPDFSGTDSFTYRASDGRTTSAAATVTINVSPENDAPRTQADTYSMLENTTLNVAVGSGVLANDVDPEGSPMTALVVSPPANGQLTLDANGAFRYTPTGGFSGTDTFTYRARDQQSAASGSTTVTINIATNRPWQNPRNPLDVNNDGAVSAIDALQIINRLNNEGSGPLPSPGPSGPPPYYDTTGDNFVAPGDALLVVNELNGGAGAEGADEPVDEVKADADVESDGAVLMTLTSVDVLPDYQQMTEEDLMATTSVVSDDSSLSVTLMSQGSERQGAIRQLLRGLLASGGRQDELASSRLAAPTLLAGDDYDLIAGSLAVQESSKDELLDATDSALNDLFGDDKELF